MKPISIALLFLSSISTCWAATTPAEELAQYRVKYPGESTILLNRKEVIHYELIGDSVVTTMDIYKELFHLGENGGWFASDEIYFSASTQVSEVEAYTLVPEKKKYKQMNVKEFKESYDEESSVFFDDNKRMSFTYPAVQVGSKTVVHYKRIFKNARLVNPFFFDSYMPVAQSTYEIHYDPRITLREQYINNAESSTKKAESIDEKGHKVLTFTASDLAKIEYKSNGPNYRYLSSGVYCPIATYTRTDGTTAELINGIASLHDWYRSLIKDLLVRDSDVEALVNTIVESTDTDLEKVRKIYLWVQENVKYIAFEDGMRGFIPHPGKYVMEKRYGDCKDMSSLIVSMLREAGVEAQYTWIGSRDIPYTYSEIPSPITDNHMIATYQQDGQIYYLDATGAYTPFGMPTSMIQGKECLISQSENEFELKTAPIIPKEQNIMGDTVNISLENGTIQGTGKATFTGYARVFNSYKLVKASPKKVEDYVNRLLSKGSNKFGISQFKVNNLDNLEVPIAIDYDFTIPDYYRKIGDEIYINLVLDKTMTDALIENRKVAIENDYKYINNNVVILKIPDGYEVKNLPNDVENHNEDFGFHIKYQRKADELIVSKQFYLEYLMLQPERFDAWNELIAQYASNCRKAIILSKKSL